MTSELDLPIHPSLALIPRMSEDELDDLAVSIKRHGLFKPIMQLVLRK
jgi:ParB-like chromosome segregation protein Spo0J